LTLAFGAIRLPIGRDAEDAVRFLQVMLAGGVADAAGLLLALIWTAGFLPTFLEPSAAAVMFSKPVPRCWLLLGKYLGVLAFVGFQATIFVGGTWAALGLATGWWIPEYLLCIPALVLQFAIMYSASVLLATCTRSAVACVLGSVFFWLFCWGLNYGRHAVVAMPYLDADASPLPSGFRTLVETIYWVLPKPADFSILLQKILQASDYHAAVPAFDTVQQVNAFHPELSILSSCLFAIVLLVVAGRELSATDY
jgi:ABC-type transport system involved in multi-copper enzyme maturation permease subunit